jgi:AraC family transcriptional regulator of arabinose operon
MDQRTVVIIAYMQNDLRHGYTLCEMARLVNLSPSRLRHLFKSDTNMTPTQYLHALRMQEAKQLLETTWLRIKEIANMVGIAGQSHFVREFKRVYGFTPAAYRAHYRRSLKSSYSFNDARVVLDNK